MINLAGLAVKTNLEQGTCRSSGEPYRLFPLAGSHTLEVEGVPDRVDGRIEVTSEPGEA